MVALPETVSCVIVVVANVLAPVTPSVPTIVVLPEIARLPPVIAAVTTKLVNVPVVEKRLVLVTLVIVAFVPVSVVIVWLVPVAEVYVRLVLLSPVAKKLVLVALPEIEALPVIVVCPSVVVCALKVPVTTKLAVLVPPAKIRAREVVLPAVATVCRLDAVPLGQLVPSARQTCLALTTRLVVVTLVNNPLVVVRLVANRFVLVAFVNTPVDGVVAPIALLSMVDPLSVKAATTIASVTELLGSDSVLVTVRLPIVAVPIVELAAVVVENVLTPVNDCVPLSKQIFAEFDKLLEDRPVIVAPVTLSVDEMVTLVLDTFVIVALLPVNVPIVANVALVVVASV